MELGPKRELWVLSLLLMVNYDHLMKSLVIIMINFCQKTDCWEQVTENFFSYFVLYEMADALAYQPCTGFRLKSNQYTTNKAISFQCYWAGHLTAKKATKISTLRLTTTDMLISAYLSSSLYLQSCPLDSKETIASPNPL